MKTITLFAAGLFAWANLLHAGYPFSPQTPAFPVPEEVIRLTTPKTLPKEIAEPSNPSYAASKAIVARTRGYAFELAHAFQEPCIVVVNGKIVTNMNGKTPVGPTIYGGIGFNGVYGMPIPFRWFETCGDPMIIGIFPLKSLDPLTVGKGYVYAVRFSDLFDKEGNLRTIEIFSHDYEARPLDRIKIAVKKPNYSNLKESRIIAQAKIPIPVEMEGGMMKPFITIGNNEWASVERVKDQEGKVIALKVTNVRDDRPLGQAGVKPGMYLVGFTFEGEKNGEQSPDYLAGGGGDMILGVKESLDPSVEIKYLRVTAASLRAEAARKAAAATKHQTGKSIAADP